MVELLSAERGEDCLAPKGSLRWNARRLIEMGDIPAIKEIADRLDGKVAQAIVGDDDSPLNIIHQITRRIVDPKA